MPSLAIFGKRTPVAGDDLQIYGAIVLLMRLSQLGIAVALVVHVYTTIYKDDFVDEQPCLDAAQITEEERQELQDFNSAFLLVSMMLASVGAVQAGMLCTVSRRGTPTDESRRTKPLQHLCHINLTALFALRVFTAATGYYLDQMLAHLCIKCKDFVLKNELGACKGKYHRMFFFLVHSQLFEALCNVILIVYLLMQTKY